MINAVRIEEGSPPLDAVDLVSLLQKKFSQLGAVLTGNAGNKCSLFCHIGPRIEFWAYNELRWQGRGISSLDYQHLAPSGSPRFPQQRAQGAVPVSLSGL